MVVDFTVDGCFGGRWTNASLDRSFALTVNGSQIIKGKGIKNENQKEN
jgi:hypothetical protein